MDSFAIIVCFGLCVAICSAHLCILEPKQRGSISGINNPGTDDCILIHGPCGGRPAETPTTIYKDNGNYTVIFQKNLDHYNKAAPGYFAVTLMSSSFTKVLAHVSDAGEKSLTLYEPSISLATVPKGTYFLQVTYVTRNPKAPAVFFQCADVQIV